MRHGRWIALAAGLAAALALTVPAGARVKSAASDKAILQAGVVTAADVPSTWTARKQTDTGTKAYKGIAACKQIVAATTTARKGPKAVSPEFSDPAPNSNTLAQNTVYAFKTVKGASGFLSAYQSSNTTTCLQQVLQKTGGKGQATVTPITNLQGVGDDAVGYEASLSGTSQSGQPVHVVVDVIGVRVGRAIVGFEFLNNDVAIPQGVGIVQGVISRVTSTVGG